MKEFAEVLNHVITLGLSVNKEVEADPLLEADNSLDLFLNELFVLFLGDLVLIKFRTSLANFFSLLLV